MSFLQAQHYCSALQLAVLNEHWELAKIMRKHAVGCRTIQNAGDEQKERHTNDDVTVSSTRHNTETTSDVERVGRPSNSARDARHHADVDGAMSDVGATWPVSGDDDASALATKEEMLGSTFHCQLCKLCGSSANNVVHSNRVQLSVTKRVGCVSVKESVLQMAAAAEQELRQELEEESRKHTESQKVRARRSTQRRAKRKRQAKSKAEAKQKRIDQDLREQQRQQADLRAVSILNYDPGILPRGK